MLQHPLCISRLLRCAQPTEWIMEKITTYLENFNFDSFWKTALLLILGIFLLGLLARFIFGKRSTLNQAVSSTIGIVFICVVTVLLRNIGGEVSRFVAPLPFVSFSGETMYLFSFLHADFPTLCNVLLSTIILAFLVNLADSWLPKGKKFFPWLFFRILTVFIAHVLHLIVVGLFNRFMPGVIITYAPMILLGVLVVMLLTGALKLVVGLVLTTVNPVIGALYTFFFATVVGKMITKAVLTTVILVLLVTGLQYIGIGALSIASAAMVGYIPFLLILVGLWYIITAFF